MFRPKTGYIFWQNALIYRSNIAYLQYFTKTVYNQLKDNILKTQFQTQSTKTLFDQGLYSSHGKANCAASDIFGKVAAEELEMITNDLGRAKDFTDGAKNIGIQSGIKKLESDRKILEDLLKSKTCLSSDILLKIVGDELQLRKELDSQGAE